VCGLLACDGIYRWCHAFSTFLVCLRLVLCCAVFGVCLCLSLVVCVDVFVVFFVLPLSVFRAVLFVLYWGLGCVGVVLVGVWVFCVSGVGLLVVLGLFVC